MKSNGNFDLEDLMIRVDQDSDFIRELIDLFLPHYPKLLGDIGSAVQGKDSTGLARAAHALKGSLATLSATHALKTATKLEAMGIEGNLVGADSMYVDLNRELSELACDLIAFKQEGVYS
jgi:two-component system, sensor histidine kinase and response regulator